MTTLNLRVRHACRGGVHTHPLDHDGPNGCHLKVCANPAHLTLTTPAGNAATGMWARRTHCPRGHDLNDPANQVPSMRDSGRVCLTCNRENGRERHRVLAKAARALGVGVNDYKAIHGSSMAVAARVIAEVEREGLGVRA